MVICPGLALVTLTRNWAAGHAVKFSHRGSMVRVRVTYAEEFVTVAVVDAGQGIPEADLPKLLKPFGKASVRGTAGEAQHRAGTGDRA